VKARELTREVLGVCLLGTGLFCLASLFSFDAADLPGRVAPPRAEPANLGGSVGVVLASSLVRWVGGLGALAAGLLTLAFAGTCLKRAVGLRDEAAEDEDGEDPAGVDPLRRLLGALVVVLTLSVIERVLPTGGLFAQGLPAGGYWGLFLERELGRLLGGVGSGLAVIVVGACGLILSTDRPLRDLLGRSVRGARDVAARARDGVAAAEEALARVSPQGEAESAPRPRLEALDPTREEAAAGAAAAPAAGAPSLGAGAVDGEEGVDGEDAEDEDHEVDGAPAAPARLPSPGLLAAPEAAPAAPAPQRDERGRRIEETLAQFKVSAKVVSVEEGPAVTLFALELGRGIKVQRITGLLDNLALTLRVPGIRLQAPIPGTGWVGLEVPNEEPECVRLRELLEHPGWQKKDPALPVFLGKDSAGRPLIADLARMPHLLIAGATGSGKSVCINSIVVSLLMTRTPRDCQLILIDPKQVEMTQFKKVPHLLSPVVTDMREAGAVLAWAVKKMEQRYDWLAAAGVRHIREYNALGKAKLAERMELSPGQLEERRIPWKLPYVVLVVDELNDLMMVAQKEVEASITRLAQKSRAVGIHVILATQRPSVDVITGVIKSNLPARLAFRVASKVDSRTILDMGGAEKLLGQGDMLFLPPGRSQPIRALGALVTDAEVRSVVKATSKRQRPAYAEDLVACARDARERAKAGSGGGGRRSADKKDSTYLEAVRVVLAAGKGSVSLVQRKLEVGYARAARYLDIMAEEGIVGPAKGSKPRDVHTTLEDWEAGQDGEASARDAA